MMYYAMCGIFVFCIYVGTMFIRTIIKECKEEGKNDK